MQEPDSKGSSEYKVQQALSAKKTSMEMEQVDTEPIILTSATNTPCPAREVQQRSTSDSPTDLGEEYDSPPPPVLTIEVKGDEPKESKITEIWRDFVNEVANHSSVSLVSLLRNSVVLELTDTDLVIGYQNIQVFTEKKRAKIEEIAKFFFNDSMRVIFKESDDGLDDSLQVKHDIAKAKEIDEIKAAAKNDVYVQEILNIFPTAEIQKITILDDITKGKR